MTLDSKIVTWAFLAVSGASITLIGCATPSPESTSQTPITISVAAPTALPATSDTTAGTLSSQTATFAEQVDRAIARFGELDDDTLGVHPYSWMAFVVATRRGWDDPLVTRYLQKVFDRQNPDGGYGIEFAWDAFQDGTTNAQQTTYAITLTDHVGPVFLAGYAAGVVPEWRVRQVIEQVETFPLADTPGSCVAYSTTDVDRPYCVLNINASAAMFLTEADAAGFDVDLSRVPQLVEHDRAAMIDGEWWPYTMNTPDVRQDWQHNATMVEAFMALDPATGRIALDAMSAATPPNSYEAAALLRLAPFDCALAQPSVLATALAEADQDAHHIGLVAYLGAIAGEACGWGM